MTKFLLGLIICFTFTGCATIVSGSTKSLHIKSDVEASNISITDLNGKEIYNGRSPATVLLKSGAGYFKKAGYNVVVTAPGYDAQKYFIEYKMNAWYFANIFIGGALGMIVVDPLTGAMWKPVTKNIYASFK